MQIAVIYALKPKLISTGPTKLKSIHKFSELRVVSWYNILPYTKFPSHTSSVYIARVVWVWDQDYLTP